MSNLSPLSITTSLVVESSESPESPILTRRRKIFGTCKGCNQPNTNFNECKSCIEWLKEQESSNLKSIIIQRKSIIYNQSCHNCYLPKHIHYKIAACNNCGFPEYSVKDLYNVAIEDVEDDYDYDYDEKEFTGIKISDLLCSKCDHPMTSWLKCPDYEEVIDMICLELNEMDYDDPDYQILLNAKEYYEELLLGQEQIDEQCDNDDYEYEYDYDQEYDDDYNEYEQYGEVIDPRAVLSILGLQNSSSLQAQTNYLSMYLFKKNY